MMRVRTDAEEQNLGADILSQFEKTVIAVYETGQLTSVILDSVARTWRGYEIPFSVGEIAASDGKTIDQICVAIICGKSNDVWGDFLKIRRDRWGWKRWRNGRENDNCGNLGGGLC